jgi:hypothetical protein
MLTLVMFAPLNAIDSICCPDGCSHEQEVLLDADHPGPDDEDREGSSRLRTNIVRSRLTAHESKLLESRPGWRAAAQSTGVEEQPSSSGRSPEPRA